METIVQFGPGQRLTGILGGNPDAGRGPLLVLPNAGLLPRTGPFRMHVELSRRLEARGMRTFRFDVPGVGESPRLRGCTGARATLAAIEHLALHHGADRFVVGGVCSAADTAWSVAVEDERVDGMLMIDGLCFAGPWFRLALAAGVLKRPPAEWPGVVRRWLVRSTATSSAPAIEDYREWPDRARARREFESLVARGVRSLWVYTGGYTAMFLHERQFQWSFGAATRSPGVEMHYWPDCDHTFFARTHRDRLMDAIEGWLEPLPASRRAPERAAELKVA